jgi:predicted flap endonuclease-1-like 5' DNA nuclease
MTQFEEPAAAWRERAAFHIAVDYTSGPNGQLIWQTRAYHEESDTHNVWPGLPGMALIAWLLAVAELPTDSPPPLLPAPPDAEPVPATPPAEPTAPAGMAEASQAADDFKQIIGIGAAIEQQLHAAGIRSYAQLAASSPAELSALLGIPVERIARRGWIARARALAKLESLPATTARRKRVVKTLQAEPPQPEATGEGASDIVFVEVAFDDSGEILEQRLLREGLPAPLEPPQGHIARFFVEPPASVAETLGAGTQPPVELALEVDDVQIEEVAAAAAGAVQRLRARAALRLAGLEASRLAREGAAYLARLLAYNLESGETKVLACMGGSFDADARDELAEAEFETPEVGRYQLMVVALLADYRALGAASGPRLRVNP